MGAALFSGCAVPINDETFYVDAGSAGAVTVNFLSTGSSIIPKDQWDTMREGMYCMDSNAMGDFKAEIEKLCSKTACSYEIKAAVNKFFSHAARVEKIVTGGGRKNL